MVEVADALAIVLERTRPLRPRVVALSPALLNQVLAVDVPADRDSPPFDKSLRDGYSIRSADCASTPVELLIVKEIAAGDATHTLIAAGECARIFTGAPIPVGADAVVMVEDTVEVGTGSARIN